MFMAPTTGTRTAVSISHLLNVIRDEQTPEKHFKHLRFLFFQTFAHGVFVFFFNYQFKLQRTNVLVDPTAYGTRVVYDRNPL